MVWVLRCCPALCPPRWGRSLFGGEKSPRLRLFTHFFGSLPHPCSAWPPPGKGSSALKWGPTWGWSEAGGENMRFRRGPPPTKTGKNNGCRQTNARTVVIYKYINFFGRVRQKSDIKKGPFLDLFLCHKNTRPNTLNKRLDGWKFFCKIFRFFCLFGPQKRVLLRAIFFSPSGLGGVGG